MSRIPIRTAQRVSLETDNDIVIIIAWNQATNTSEFTTYGKTKGLCTYAASMGRMIQKSLGFKVDENEPTRTD